MKDTPYEAHCSTCASQTKFSCFKLGSYKSINYPHRICSNCGCSNKIPHCNHEGFTFVTRAKTNKEHGRAIKKHINHDHHVSSLFLPPTRHNTNELVDSNTDNLFTENDDVIHSTELIDNTMNNTDTTTLKENDANAIQKLERSNFNTS